MNMHIKRAVLLLGTYHMGNPGLDMHNAQADNVLTPKRQQEIKEVIERLKQFKPTKIAVEALSDKDEELKKQYHLYLAGEFDLTANEIHQLGFRTAAELGHDQIYPVDWNEWIGGVSLGDVYDYAKANQPELFTKLNSVGEEHVYGFEQAQTERTVRQLLLGGNTQEAIKGDQEIYMTLAQVGDGKNNIGIDWLCNYWYRRNMIIYANITRISTAGDRILVIYGSGHMHLLTQFMKESGLYTIESVETYLGDRSS